MNLFNAILNFIYPKRCVVCGDILEIERNDYLCDICRKEYKNKKVIRIKDQGDILLKNSDYFDSAYAIYPYDEIKKGIENFKFKGCKSNGSYLAEIMVKKAEEHVPWVFHKTDIIIAVPMHNKKKNLRGFNQAEVLAEEISLLMGIPIVKGNLMRTKNTLPQSTLTYEKRIGNIKNAFSVVKKDEINGKSVLLIDDIYTTGATLNECAKVLKKAGAVGVGVFTLSATKLGDRLWKDTQN